MRMSKIRKKPLNIFLILLCVALLTVEYFNISLTSLPTTFSEATKDNLANQELFDEVE